MESCPVLFGPENKQIHSRGSKLFTLKYVDTFVRNISEQGSSWRRRFLHTYVFFTESGEELLLQ